eukprot:TRINITY_DN18283_c0_g1_i4.p1 TRINITY_DN18283_c0_g1~~TRINITY_DN18283_c0_g1_i4.p1  ORF type:complete len:353 (+),score=89.65 TRINITY_DN18283_c0_g1_i4:256-1314(+)
MFAGHSLVGLAVGGAPFSSRNFCDVVQERLETRREWGGAGLNIPELIDNGVLLASFGPHGPEELAPLRENWAAFRHFNKGILSKVEDVMPLDDIRDYFGEKVGLYFGYLGYYTSKLVAPAVLGFFVTLVQLIQGFDYGFVIPTYAVLIVIWGALFLEGWKRRQISYAQHWGTLDFEEKERQRPQFKGELCTDRFTGESEVRFSKTARQWRHVSTYSVVALLVIIVGGFVILTVVLKVYLTEHYLHSVVSSALVGLINGVTIFVFNRVYSTVAIKLTDFENHQTETAHEDSLIFKTFLFQFMNSYLTLYFIAFIKPHAGGAVSYTHLRAHETVLDLVCRLLLEKKKNTTIVNH